MQLDVCSELRSGFPQRRQCVREAALLAQQTGGLKRVLHLLVANECSAYGLYSNKTPLDSRVARIVAQPDLEHFNCPLEVMRGSQRIHLPHESIDGFLALLGLAPLAGMGERIAQLRGVGRLLVPLPQSVDPA